MRSATEQTLHAQARGGRAQGQRAGAGRGRAPGEEAREEVVLLVAERARLLLQHRELPKVHELEDAAHERLALPEDAGR